MNKTININLANTFFHIDEDAYSKLQRYLDAIKRSFTDSQGKSEIIADIEARIAELFTERIIHERQVITTKEVDEIITIMGQPEDYLVDDEIFEDNPNTRKTAKQLYRDTDNKRIAGVCAGLGHYINIDAIWIRLLFILVVVFGFGTGVLIYILLWILVPEATTTAQKIAMNGDPVNISNIEKKIKESFEEVSEKVKNVDYEKVGQTVKKNSKNFFDSILSLITFLFKIAAKFIGIIVLTFSAIVLIALFIGLFTTGTIDIWGYQQWSDFIDVTVNAPIWLISLLSFFTLGIPFFFLLYVGLKILVTNLKSIGSFAKFSLLGVWLLSIIGLITLGVRTATEYSFESTATENQSIPFSSADTLEIKIIPADNFKNRYYKNNDYDIVMDGNNKLIYSEDVDFNIKPSQNNEIYLEIEKHSKGSNYKNALERAENIQYHFKTENNTLALNNYLTASYANKFRNQEVDITIFIPKGTLVKLHHSTEQYFKGNIKNNMNYHNNDLANHIWEMDEIGILNCRDCPITSENDKDDKYENGDEENDDDDDDKQLEENTPEKDTTSV